ncbi:MAG TPA: S1 RNA-binding domain-containing protein [Polyangiaceae bacterium]|nr:S1 RNA-binding domain-containing protein [Polyangiaceae bacterium]
MTPEETSSGSEAAPEQAAPEANAPATEASAGSNGEGPPDGDANSASNGAAELSDGDDSSDGDATEGDAAPNSAAAADGTVPTKKKRKRRRKKKPAGDAQAAGAEGNGPAEGAPQSGQHGNQHGGQHKTRKEGGGKNRKRQRPATDRVPFHVGEEVFGRVTAVLEHAIMVDLVGKALAIFDRGEMAADDLVPEVSERFVARVHQDGARGGLVVLTRKPLREEEAKPKVEQAAKEGTPIHGLVTGIVKGGVDVDIDGLRAFAPASGMDLHPQNANFAGLVGSRLDFKVIEYEKGGRDVVVTRRPMLEAEAHERRKHALTLLQEGQVMQGVVRTVVDWGAFVALPEAENLEGLVHVTEASHDPRANCLDLFKAGEKIEVKITKIDERGKIWLSRKALIDDPWAKAKEKYAPGTVLKGKITGMQPFGVFVDVDGFEGLIHISDLSLKRLEHPSELVKEGDEIDVVVHQLDPHTRKLSLHPAPTGDQANEPKQKITRNSGIKVMVVKAEPGGLLVRIMGVTGRYARGFIPAGQTGTLRGTDLRKKFPVGMQLDAKVVETDPKRGEAKLSIKQLAEDEERQAHKQYRTQLAKEGGFGTLGDLLGHRLK